MAINYNNSLGLIYSSLALRRSSHPCALYTIPTSPDQSFLSCPHLDPRLTIPGVSCPRSYFAVSQVIYRSRLSLFQYQKSLRLNLTTDSNKITTNKILIMHCFVNLYKPRFSATLADNYHVKLLRAFFRL